jgi:DNA polymerase IV
VVSGVAAILHADLDAFYASVEQMLDPSLRGRPIAVGGGVVLAASYEARAFGVRGGMPGRQAKLLCPSLLFVGGHFSEYQRLGDAAIAVLHDFTPVVERVSIDEAFCDVSGSIRLFGSPCAMAATIRARVQHELGLPISIGVARTKHLAKIGSQVAKPNGMIVIEPENEIAFLTPLPVGLVWGVGPATKQRLADRGITTIGELAATEPAVLRRLLGDAVGSKLSDLAGSRDPRSVETGTRVSSVGAQSAFPRRPPTDEVITPVLGHLADRVAGRLRARQRAGRTITVRVRFNDLRAVTRSLTLASPVSATRTLAEVAGRLVRTAVSDQSDGVDLTLLAITVSHLTKSPVLQLELPLGLDDEVQRPGTPVGAARWAVDHSIDSVRKRFGRDAVGYAAVELSSQRLVPDEFRELAERDG